MTNPDVIASGDEHLDESEPFSDAADESVALRRARRRSVLLALALSAVAIVIAVPLAFSPRHPWFQGADTAWRDWMVAHRFGAATDAARVLSVVGSVVVTLPLRLIAGLVLAVRKRWLQLAAFAAAIITSEIAVGVVKALIDRPRPPGGLVTTTGSSFPSGHAIATAVTALGLVVAFVPRGQRRWHWLVIATGLAATMSWSRTYLSVHWATDTIAGTCIGMGLALFAEALFEGGRHVIAQESRPDEAGQEDATKVPPGVIGPRGTAGVSSV